MAFLQNSAQGRGGWRAIGWSGRGAADALGWRDESGRSCLSRGVSPMPETIDESRLNDLLGKVIGDVAGAMSVFMAYLGDQAGVFYALDGAGRLTLEQLAAK